MKMTVIPIVGSVLGTVPYGLKKRMEELEIRERIEAIQHYQNHREYSEET